MPDNKNQDKEFTFKDYFVPLTTVKAIHFIVIIGFIVFGNMLFNNFVWDDKAYTLLPDNNSKRLYNRLLNNQSIDTALK